RSISPEMSWLIAWALGGIVVMSLIPSKRPDRIFPSVPPLCLLLAAQFNYFKERKHSEALLRRVIIAGILASAVYAGGYAATRVSAIKDNESGTKYIFVTRKAGSTPVAP